MSETMKEPKEGTKAAEKLAVRRRVLCAKHGHPPVVTMCFGYVHCARCEAQIGDTLAGTYPVDARAVVGHDCERCRAVWDAMTPEQIKLTPGRPS